MQENQTDFRGRVNLTPEEDLVCELLNLRHRVSVSKMFKDPRFDMQLIDRAIRCILPHGMTSTRTN